MEASTCMRGFSNTFVPNTKIKVMDLQYVESEELEQTWKAARRQRLKQQEDKIWDEFVKEQDILKSVCKEDPYQFIDQFPEGSLKEMMETEIQTMKMTLEQEHKRGAGDSPICEAQHTVTFSELDQDEMFRIFEEEKEDDLSIQEDDGLNESIDTPNTVRERMEANDEVKTDSGKNERAQQQPSTSKSNENVANMIESSIYCAKVKDLRIKINMELISIMTSLERLDVSSMDPHRLRATGRRAAEFCARFQRIHLYQLQRHIHDIKRHNQMALPFAKYTQFQSQMVRIVALHQTMLQSLQVFHKSFEQTSCLRECGELVASLCGCLREAGAACAAVTPPADFTAARELYHDDIIATCEKLEATSKEYVERVEDFVNAAENRSARSKKSSKSKGKKKAIGVWTKSNNKTNADKMEANTRLSMYSLETLRPNPMGKGKSGKGDKLRGIKHELPKSYRKSPRFRRPLMRDPQSGQPRRRQPEADIRTMVEVVEVPSSHISEASPRGSARRPRPRRRAPPPATAPRARTPHDHSHPPHTQHVTNMPQSSHMTPHTSQSPRVPQSPQRQMPQRVPGVPPLRVKPGQPGLSPGQSPRVNPRLQRVSSAYNRAPLSSIRSVSETQETVMGDPLTPVSRIQCAKKHTESEFSMEGFEAREELETTTSKYEYESCTTANEFRDAPVQSSRVREVRSDGKENVAHASNGTASARSTDRKTEKEKKMADGTPAGCEVTRLLKQLCGGDTGGTRSERSGAKNAQLVCINSSPRQPSTPQLLRILEETIQKKVPKSLYHKPKPKTADRLRLTFNIPQQTADNLFQYRTKFVQHMLASSLYANSAVGKPWEMIGSVSQRIIDEILLKVAKQMQIQNVIMELYKRETQ